MITKRRQICWPPVSDQKDIQLTVWLGCFAALFYAGNWGLNILFGTIYGIITTDSKTIFTALSSIAHFVIAASIGWGIYKKYKTATITGLLLSIIGFIGNGVAKGFTNTTSIICLVDVWMFVHSTRGIFAYHKMNMITETNEIKAV